MTLCYPEVLSLNRSKVIFVLYGDISSDNRVLVTRGVPQGSTQEPKLLYELKCQHI